MCAKLRVGAQGIVYVTCQGTEYCSWNYHRSRSNTRHRKSVWIIERSDECELLCFGESHIWFDSNGNCWAIRNNGKEVVGDQNERYGYFEAPSAPGMEWHGYPVSGRASHSSPRRPPDDVVALWLKAGEITYATAQRIMTDRL